MFAETFVMLPVAVGYIIFLGCETKVAFQILPVDLVVFLPTVGIVTVVPLLMFAVAAKALPLYLMGFLQYFSPAIALLLEIFLCDEVLSSGYLYCFGCIWFALFLLSMDNIILRINIFV